MRTCQIGGKFERTPIMADCLFLPAGAGERDGDVFQRLYAERLVAQRQLIGGNRPFVVPLPLERESLVEVVEPLGTNGTALSREDPFPPVHEVIPGFCIGGKISRAEPLCAKAGRSLLGVV